MTRTNTNKKRTEDFFFRKIVPILYQSFTEEKFRFVDGSSEEKRKVEKMHFEPGLYPSIVDIIVVMNRKTRERHGAQIFD